MFQYIYFVLAFASNSQNILSVVSAVMNDNFFNVTFLSKNL
jgi:hypothetical protein